MYCVYFQVQGDQPAVLDKHCEFFSGPHKTLKEARESIRTESEECFQPDSDDKIGVPLEDWSLIHFIVEVKEMWKAVPTLSVDVELKRVRTNDK